MPYTVKKLAAVSGVSVRTLHFYDEIGLLIPAYVGDNGYRYYEKEELLMLQQILFFRELGFELKNIQSILKQTDFDKVKALKTHRQILQAEKLRMQKLINTVDKTIKQLNGEKEMNANEMFDGFNAEKQKEYVAYLKNRLGEHHPAFAESEKNAKKWSKTDWEEIKMNGEQELQKLTKALEQGLEPSSSQVQKLMQDHYQWVKQFWTPDQVSYIGLGQLYCEHEEFRKYFEAYNRELPEFLADAMKVYAKKNLQ